MLCYQSQDFMLGRQNCGYLYRDKAGVGAAKYEYVYVNAFSRMRFSIKE